MRPLRWHSALNGDEKSIVRIEGVDVAGVGVVVVVGDGGLAGGNGSLGKNEGSD